MRMQQVTAFADIAALSPSSTVRRAMCCRDTARAMPPLCFSKIGLLAFQHQSATGGSSPLAKAMRSCFIIKTPSATRRQALCLDIKVLDKDGNEIELKDDDDEMTTFNLARMDADRDDREEYVADDAAFEESGFGIEDAEEDDFAVDSDDEL